MARERLAVGSFLVMESLIAFAIASVLAAGAGGHGPSYITVLLAMLGGIGLARLLQRIDVSPIVLALVGAGVTVLALTVLLNVQYNPGGNPLSFSWLTGFAGSPDGYLQSRWPQTWGVILVGLAWLRAVTVAQQEFSYGLVLFSFSVGLLLFVVALLFGQGSNVHDRINYSALPFFLTGLFALSLLQLRRAEASDPNFARGPWLPVVLGTIGALAVISAALGFFPLGFFFWALRPIGLLLLRALDIVIYLIALPIGWLVTFFITRILGRSTFEWPTPQQAATGAAEEVQQAGDRSGFVEFLLLVFQFLFVLAVLAVIGYILYRVFLYLRRPSKREMDAPESVEREGSIGEDLNALWRGLMGRFNRPKPAIREPELPEGARRVRRLYLELLDDAEERGVARPAPATPHEFSPTLTRTYADPAPDRLSDRFAAARYGRVEPTREEVEELERGVNAAKRAGR